MSFLSPWQWIRAGRTQRSPGAHATSWAQLAAVVALVAVAGMVGIVLLAIATEFGDLLLGLASVFVLAFSGWFVVTRRRPVRQLGILGVLLGLVGLVNFVGEHWAALFELSGAIALFAVAGRYALRHERTTLDRARQNARPARPAGRGVLIINPNSGGGKAQRFNLPEEARRRGIEPLLLDPGADLRELARGAVADGADVLGMAGGDGSQALVAAVAVEHNVAHVCVPAGTRNHFALDLGLDRNDVVGALDAFTDGIERRIDLASVNERIFVNNASLGVYARVVQSDAYREAKLGTWSRMLPDVLGPSATSMDLQFEGPDASDWTDATLVVVSNNPYQLGHLGGAGSRPRLDSGQLGVLATRIRGARDLARLATLGTLGQSQRFRGVREWACPEFEVRSGDPLAVGLDGEALVLAPPLRFVSLPGVLRVRVPRHARGVSPAGAAVPLTQRNVAGLIGVAVRKPNEREKLDGEAAT
jgi:diacylglycerol kinase family enzyme